jgi:hypothetical protein
VIVPVHLTMRLVQWYEDPEWPLTPAVYPAPREMM